MSKREAAREKAQATVDAAAAAAQPSPPMGEGSKGILVRVSPETWNALKSVAIGQGRTLQGVMVEAVRDFLRKHGKPPTA